MHISFMAIVEAIHLALDVLIAVVTAFNNLAAISNEIKVIVVVNIVLDIIIERNKK